MCIWFGRQLNNSSTQKPDNLSHPQWRALQISPQILTWVIILFSQSMLWWISTRISSCHCHHRANWWWKSFLKEHAALWAATHISSCHCRQVTGWWWKSFPTEHAAQWAATHISSCIGGPYKRFSTGHVAQAATHISYSTDSRGQADGEDGLSDTRNKLK